MRTTEAPGAWRVVGVLFVVWFLVWGGGLNTSAVFFPPVLAHFGWSRATLSGAFAVAALSAGVGGTVVGWLLDRIDARKVVAVGVALTAGGYIALGRTTNLTQFVLCNLVIGVGLVASTGIPSSLVLANWFHERRGLAMGIALAGGSIGGAIMTPIVSGAIAAWDWRTGYLVIAIPMAVITIPLVLAVVRTRPGVAAAPERSATEALAAAAELPGLEVGEALRTRSMWLITLVQFLSASLFAGVGQHFVAYLIDIGYSAGLAARVLSLSFVFTTIGSLGSGPVADRVNARWSTAVTWGVTAIAMLALLGAAHVSALVVYAVLVGLVGGALGVLGPLLMLESVGIRRYGSLMGIAGLVGTLGYAAGPIATGWIHDRTATYVPALWMFVAVCAVCGTACLACRPLQSVLDERAGRPPER